MNARLASILCLGLLAAGPAPPGPPPGPAPGSPGAATPGTPAAAIVAVVNGAAITSADVDHRRRLFAVSTGLPATKEVLDRLTPQVTRQLIDEKLRLQEVQRRKIVVPDKDIAEAIAGIEKQNNMPQGALRARFAADGIGLRTLIDQIRVQLGWTSVLRQTLGDKARPTDAEIAEQINLIKAEAGKPEFRVGEIFIPVEDPAHDDEARKFSDTVIGQLRAGAPFAVVAAQFSQSQTALSGGDRGWLQPSQLDPAVAAIITEMPQGAVSNPIRVPGGYEIVTLRAKRVVGDDPATMVRLRQVFLPFATPLNQANPTDAQRAVLDKARGLSQSTRGCDAMEAANAAAGTVRPSDPGEVRLEGVNPPAFRQLLASLPVGQASAPLVAPDGIALVMVCAREAGNAGLPSKEDIANQILGERAELAARQLLRELTRRAVIDVRA